MKSSMKYFLVWATFSCTLLALPKIYAFFEFDHISEEHWYELETNNIPLEDRPSFEEWREIRETQEQNMKDEFVREWAYTFDPWYDGKLNSERD
jgi:hypothetical protein